MKNWFDSLRQALLGGERVTAFARADRNGAGEIPAGRLLVRADGSTSGSLGDPELDRRATALAADPGGPLRTGLQRLGDAEILVEVFEPPPRLLIVGAVHVAIHLVYFARRLGFHSVVVDARSAFATAERFPHADELIVEWPANVLQQMPLHQNTCCVFLTHDEKLDDPALQVALQADVRYIDALGSTRTPAKRVARLTAARVPTSYLLPIHSPIGVDL